MSKSRFNVTEFRNIKNQSGSNGYVLSGKQWIEKANAKPAATQSAAM